MAYSNPDFIYTYLSTTWLNAAPVSGLTIFFTRRELNKLSVSATPCIVVVPTVGVGGQPVGGACAEDFEAQIDSVKLRYEFYIFAANVQAAWILQSWLLTGLRKIMGQVSLLLTSFDDADLDVPPRGTLLTSTMEINVDVTRFETALYNEALVEEGTINVTVEL